MGYYTDFKGKLTINPPLEEKHKTYLEHFSQTRRMKRNISVIKSNPELFKDPIREAVGLDLGIEGEFYVGSDIENFGQDMDISIMNYNAPPATQHHLWCPWYPSKNGKFLHCADGKSYEFDKWLSYITEKFFKPWNYSLSGEVRWLGEDDLDRGFIVVNNNELSFLTGNDYENHKIKKAQMRKAKKLKTDILSEIGSDDKEKPNKNTTKLI